LVNEFIDSAVEENAVVICCDANLAWQAAFLLESLHTRIERGTTKLYCFIDVPFEPVYMELLQRYAKVIVCEGLFDPNQYKPPSETTRTHTHVSSATFLRLFAIDVLSKLHPRVLYLDIDVYLDCSSLDTLLRLELTQPLAAIRDYSCWKSKVDGRVHTYLQSLLPDVGTKYFNAGVLLINSALFLEADVIGRARYLLRERPDLCRLADQSALNGAAQGCWDEISPAWNWQMGKHTNSLSVTRSAQIIHFVGGRKPWLDNIDFYDQRFARDMKAFLVREHLGDDLAAMEDAGYQPHRERRRIRLTEEWANGSLRAYHAILPYLDREDFVDLISARKS
jgi:lipopolysaccharide biosynthesis glycosyltransferase